MVSTSLPETLAAKVVVTRALLAEAARDFSPAVFTSSFGAEDMVLFDLIGREFRAIGIATLDTGRLPEQTYQVWHQATERYQRKVDVYFPQAGAVEQYVRIHGINAFYDSVAQRKDCCAVRKVEPLQRALAGKRAWVTGLRRAQAVTRSDLPASEFDAAYQLQKFSPLADWTEDDVWAYIRAHDVPYNALHDQAYPSIGCAPCTRAIQPGEDVRAGRWWWEDAAGKECGLHVHDVSPLSSPQQAGMTIAS